MTNDPPKFRDDYSDLGKKAGRNLLLFAILAFALVFGLLWPDDKGTVTFAGIGAITSMKVVYGVLFMLIAYNLMHFRQHAPLHVNLHRNRVLLIFGVEVGGSVLVDQIFAHVRSIAGEKALPPNVSEPRNLSDWLGNQLPNSKRTEGLDDRSNYYLALESYWKWMDRYYRIKLWWHAFWSPDGKRLWWDYYIDLRFPWWAGWAGLVCSAYGFAYELFLRTAASGGLQSCT